MKHWETALHHPGMRTFLWVWFGQLVSITGTAMTRFALMIWAYEQTGRAMSLALLGVANFVPYLALCPLAGVLVDRLDRRKLMLISDALSGLVTAGLLALYISGQLAIWHLYLAEALSGTFEAFQLPSYNAAISTLVPPEQLNRTNGLRSLARFASSILAPLTAGALLAGLGLQTIMMVDLATFAFSVVILARVFIPRPVESAEGRESRGSFFGELRYGLGYIAKRRGLVGLLAVMLGMNLLASLTYYSILPAMILARSGLSEWTLGVVQSVLGVGGIAGAVMLSTWGGPRRKIDSVLAGGALSFLLGDLLFALGRGVEVWVLAAFFSSVFIPFISGSEQTIWQMKVPHDLQGRVLAVKNTVQQLMVPAGYLAAGFLADGVFEPGMQPGGALAAVFGRLVGIGPGAGMGVMFLFTWLAGTLFCLGGYRDPRVRNVEREVPDAVGGPVVLTTD